MGSPRASGPHVGASVDYKEFPGRSHFTVGEKGWEEVADFALDWALEHADAPARAAEPAREQDRATTT